MMGSAEGWATGWEPWTAPALDDLLPELSVEEQLRLRSHLREHKGIRKWCSKDSPPLSSWHTEGRRDALIIPEVRHALHHYNAKHQGDEFDAVKPLMKACVGFRGQRWVHVNFWARCRKSKKIKRFFAEVHYKPPSCSSVCLDPPSPVPVAEVHYKPAASSSACWDPAIPVPIPIVEVCTIIEEPLGQYRRSCAFCCGHRDILHPKGRKFVCGNDKDRMIQRLTRFPSKLEMPFTCRLGPESPSSEEEEEAEKREF